jgi:hypothetical protein
MSLLRRLFNQKFKSKDKADSAQKSDKSSYYPEKQLPADENFMLNFKNNGGKFIYCENWEEVMEMFDNILLENDWYEKDVFCYNEKLRDKFDGFNLKFGTNPDSSFFLLTCESLIARTGAIMLSSNQIKEKKLEALPHHFVIVATTSQIVETISEGLRVINNRQSGSIPSNITTIRHFKELEENDFLTYGSSTKNLYLLLLEDL